MPITTTSKDTLSDGTTPVSFSQMRDYYGITGAVSLSGSLNKTTLTVPDSLPAEEEEISVSDFRTKNRILVKMGITDTIVEGNDTAWTSRQPDAIQYHVYTIGGGGSGGCSSGYGGEEKGGTGGGAGGVAFKRYTSEELSLALITVGEGGQAVSISGVRQQKTGYNGDSTLFKAYDSDSNLTSQIFGAGGQRGRGGRQGRNSGEGNTVATTARWGFAYGADSRGGLFGDENYFSGGSPTVYSYAASAFTEDGDSYPADTTNRDDSAVSSGGSVNLGFGVTGSNANGNYLDFQGLEAEHGATSFAPQPVLPPEWENHVIAPNVSNVNELCTFKGGTAIGETSGLGGPSGAPGAPIGAGGGGSSAQEGSALSGAGSNGGVIVTYYGLPNATVVDYDLPSLPTSAPARVQFSSPSLRVDAFSGTLGGSCTAEARVRSDGTMTFAVSGTQGGGNKPSNFTWLVSGNAIDYEVRFDHEADLTNGEMVEDAGTDWVNLATTRTWRVRDDGNNGEPSFTNGTIEIRDASTQEVLATSYLWLEAQHQP